MKQTIYAGNTHVPIQQSAAEIEKMVRTAGATSFYRGDDGDKAVIGFQLKDRRIMFELPLGRGRDQSQTAYEQALRSRWRALVLAIKSKLVSVAAGVESFEEAFLAHIVVPHEGRATRFAAVALQAIARAYESGKPMPPLLGG